MLPFIRITETFFLPSYMLVLSATYCLCLYLIFKKAGDDDFKKNIALDLSLCIMIFGFLGARLFHILYEYPSFYISNPLEIFKVWRGGFVYYGGFIGALLGTFIFIKKKKLAFLEWADFFTPILSLGYALGRVGCFLNGCCYGQLCNWPWAIEFNHPGLPTGLRHPTQLYASFYELIVFGFLLFLSRYASFSKSKVAFRQSWPTGSLFLVWLVLHGLGRSIMEYFRDDERGAALFNLSVSTWLSLFLIAISVYFIFKLKRKNT